MKILWASKDRMTTDQYSSLIKIYDSPKIIRAEQNITDVNNHEYTYAVGTIYMDLINECEKLADYVVNVVEARMGLR